MKESGSTLSQQQTHQHSPVTLTLRQTLRWSSSDPNTCSWTFPHKPSLHVWTETRRHKASLLQESFGRRGRLVCFMFVRFMRVLGKCQGAQRGMYLWFYSPTTSARSSHETHGNRAGLHCSVRIRRKQVCSHIKLKHNLSHSSAFTTEI